MDGFGTSLVTDDGARTAVGSELVVLTGTRLCPPCGAPHFASTPHPRHGKPYWKTHMAKPYSDLTARPAKSAIVSSSVQSPSVPFEKRSSRSFNFSSPS